MTTRTHRGRRALALAGLSALTMFAAACGAGPTGSRPTPEPPTPTAIVATPTPTPPTPPPAPAGLVRSLEEVRLATIRIASKGNFVEPGQLNGASFAGSGSGFIIDPSGIAVTNNHVVTGAALIEVYVGDEDEPRNARVLGVSECSDLAVIDIEGDGFPYLEWYAGDIVAGLGVYTAGFPRGEPEYTITGGVVSKDRTSGESDWASVERVIEHDATIRPGNSGGPLVSEDGQVVGVNYAGAAGGPFYAIGRDEALAIIDTLRAGEDVTSLGLNGQAIQTEEFSGIWVWSVESGSPLDNVGVKPGDFIARLEGLEMGADGTMADYCQILRTRDPGAVFGIQVVRPGTGQVLEGQVNRGMLEPVDVPAPAATTTGEGGEEPAAPASAVVAYDPGAIDVAQARGAADAARGQLRQLVFETFDRGWPTRNSWLEDADSILRDNFYRLRVAEPNVIRSVYWRPDRSDVRLGDSYMLELDVAFDTGGATGGVGLVFEGQDETDSLSFIIRSDSSWQMVSFADGAFSEQYSSDPVPTDAINGGVNRLRVWRTPAGASVWINNTPVGELPSPFGGGFVGVAAFGGEDVSGPITLIVDNFRVLAP